MNGIRFYAHNSSPALCYAVQWLKKLGISVTDTPDSQVTHLLLNVPSFDRAGNLKGGGTLEQLLEALPPDVTVVGGNLPEGICGEYPAMDLLRDALYLAQNAAITADCAIQLARQKLPVVWKGCPVLVLGWGRIGKCLANDLRSIGADVTVAARKEEDIAILRCLGFGAEDIHKLHYGLMRYRVIFNTVPQMLLTANHTAHCREDCLLVELASQPGMAAENILDAQGLPGRLAPETSGKLIANTIIRKLMGREC